MAQTEVNRNKKFIVDENGNIVMAQGSESSAKSQGFKRFVSIVLWLLAIALECSAVLKYKGIFDLFPQINTTVFIICAFALDFILVIIAVLLWKSANRIEYMNRPGEKVSTGNKTFSVILSVIAFFPFIIISLIDKDNKGAPKIAGSIFSLLMVGAYICIYMFL